MNNKEKVILILTHVVFDSSPYCSYVHSHAKALKEQGYKVIVLAMLNYFPLITLIRPNRKKIYEKYKGINIVDGIEVIYKKHLSFSNFFSKFNLNVNGFFYYLSVKNIVKKLMKKYNLALIDAHTYEIEGYVASKLKKKYNIKTFITCHGTKFNNVYQTNKGKKEILNRSFVIDYYIGVSHKIVNQLKSIGVNNAKVIYNGVNSFNNKANKKIKYSITTIGSLDSGKNIGTVIEAFKNITQKYPDASLTIIGNGPLENELKNQAEDIKNIKFTGYLENYKAQEILSKSEIFVLPSSPEGFGIAYVEAMNNNCITIGTRGEGIDGFIRNVENGFLVNVDSNEISDLIIDIFNDKYDTKKILNIAKKDASKLTWEENASNYIKLMEDKNEGMSRN